MIVGDKIYMYASGRNSLEDTTGLLIWRRDGFISMHGGQSEGELTTRLVRFSGKHLFVNLAAPDGSLNIDLLDREGRLLDTSQTLSGDRTLMKVEWEKSSDLSAWAGQSCAIPIPVDPRGPVQLLGQSRLVRRQPRLRRGRRSRIHRCNGYGGRGGLRTRRIAG